MSGVGVAELTHILHIVPHSEEHSEQGGSGMGTRRGGGGEGLEGREATVSEHPRRIQRDLSLTVETHPGGAYLESFLSNSRKNSSRSEEGREPQ